MPNATPATDAELADRCRSVRQLARHWRCAPKRVRDLIRRGLLQAFQLGQAVRISPEAVTEAERLLAVATAKPRKRRQPGGIDPSVLALLEGGAE